MTSEMQRDIERIEPLIPFDPETREAWQRIRQRLSPDREVVARAMRLRYFGAPDSWDALDSRARNSWLSVVDAALDAARKEEI